MTRPLAAFVVATLAVIAIEVVKRRVAVELAIRHAAELRNGLFRARLAGRAPTSSKGNLLLPFVGDLTAARRWQSEGLPRAVSALVLLPVVLAMIAWSSPLMALAMGAALVASLGTSALLFGPLERAVREVRSHRGALTSYLTGRLLAVDVVRSSGRIGFEVNKASRRTGHLANAERRRAWAVGATRGSARLTTGLLLLAALYSGVSEVAKGHLTAGSVAGALTLVALLGQSVTDLARAFEYWKPAKVSYERIAAIIGKNPRIRKRTTRPTSDLGLLIGKLEVGGGLRVDHATAASGSIVIVDGQNRTGKSALLAAIAIPGRGRDALRLDGVDLRTLDERRRAKLVGYARSGMPLLPASLGHNLDYRGSGAGPDKLLEVARLCGLQPLIDRLPGGLAGRIREDSELSSSERAGIALGRAMIGNPPLLLLDSIDAELDGAVLGAVAERLAERQGITLIVAQKSEWRAIGTVRWLLAEGRLHQDVGPTGDNVVAIDRGGL